jgi:DNA-binding MarR family transcriptional regulator
MVPVQIVTLSTIHSARYFRLPAAYLAVVTEAQRRQELVEETLGMMRRVLSRSIRSRPQRPGKLALFFAREHLAFHFVMRSPGATHADLAKFLGVTPSHVSGVVDSLERKGLVTRVPDKVDRRIHRLELTAKGGESHRRMHERFGEPTSPIFEGWSDSEIETLRQMLERLDTGRRTQAHSIASEASQAPRSNGSPT